MIHDQFTPQEQSLIERLQNAPQRQLKSIKVEAIETQILNAVDLPRVSPRPKLSLPRTFPALVALAVIVAVIVYVANSHFQQQQSPASGTTPSSSTQVAVIFTATTGPTTITESATPSKPATSESVTSTPIAVTTSQQASSAASGQTLAPTLVAPSEPVIVVEGPLRAIQDNQLSVYDLTVIVAADDPILNIIKVGDMVHIEGQQTETGTITALQVSNIVGGPPGSGTALVDGRVKAIDGNLLTINGIKVRLSPNDPRLKTIQVGNFLSINGNFQRQGTTVVLIVVNLVIINDADVNAYLNCRKSDGMGNAGMGMGNDAMGMGMGDDGMGMGEPAMGMGNDGGIDCRP